MTSDYRSERDVAGLHRTRAEELATLPGKVVAYWLPASFIHALQTIPTADSVGIEVYSGLQTDDDFRFLRLWWEVPADVVGSAQWPTFAKGGDYAPFADDFDLLVNWESDGAEILDVVADLSFATRPHIRQSPTGWLKRL